MNNEYSMWINAVLFCHGKHHQYGVLAPFSRCTNFIKWT